MATKRARTKPKQEYDFLHLEVLKYSLSVDGAINCEARDRRLRHDETPVYCFYSDASIECRLIWPDDRPDWDYHIHVYGESMTHRDFAMTLKDCQVLHDYGRPKCQKRGGMSRPIYDVPYGLGLWEKERGVDRMSGAIWISRECLTDMMLLLINVKPLWAHVHELKVGRNRWITGFRLQTERPE